MGKTVSLRDKLRSKTVGAKKQFKSEIVEWDGEQYEIRQPSVGQRGRILQAAKVQTGDAEKMDLAKLQVMATVCCTYVPGEDTPVFEEADIEALMELPAGSFVDEFAQVALRFMNVDAEEAAKNSTTIASASSSST